MLLPNCARGQTVRGGARGARGVRGVRGVKPYLCPILGATDCTQSTYKRNRPTHYAVNRGGSACALIPHQPIFPYDASFSGCGFKDCFGMEGCDAQEHLDGSAGCAAAVRGARMSRSRWGASRAPLFRGFITGDQREAGMCLAGRQTPRPGRSRSQRPSKRQPWKALVVILHLARR